MYPVSAAFKEKVRGSHKMALRVEVWRAGVKQADIFPIGGEVEVDARRTHRRTCTVVLPATDGVVPGVNLSLLSPYGNELLIWRGVFINRSTQVPKIYKGLADNYADYDALDTAFVDYTDLGAVILIEVEEPEWVPQGAFIITEVDIDSADGATVVVRGVDRSLRISRNRWAARYRTEDGETLDDVIINLLRSRWADVPLNIEESSDTVSRTVLGLDEDNDPWEDAQGIAASKGYSLFFDQSGVCVLRGPQDYSVTEPAEVYEENSEATVLGVARNLTSERSYNGAIVTGEGTKNNTVFSATAWDNDPKSPTFYRGPYGPYPQFYTSSTVNSESDAAAAANRLVTQTKGLVENVNWSQIVDPSLDADDYVRVKNTLANIDRSFVIDRLTIPLDPDTPMSAVARTIRIDGRFDEEFTA
jgi:hypothetical protein